MNNEANLKSGGQFRLARPDAASPHIGLDHGSVPLVGRHVRREITGPASETRHVSPVRVMDITACPSTVASLFTGSGGRGRRFVDDHRRVRRTCVMRPRSSCAQFGMDFDYDVGSAIVSVHGELDALSVPAFAGALIALANRGTNFVTLDLSQLRYCSVGGLRAMAELAARVNAVGGQVEVLAPAILTRMLDVNDLNTLFVIRDPQTAAPAADEFDAAISRASQASRPRTSSLHRLSTGA